MEQGNKMTVYKMDLKYPQTYRLMGLAFFVNCTLVVKKTRNNIYIYKIYIYILLKSKHFVGKKNKTSFFGKTVVTPVRSIK
jgi:hypothetical protein